MSVSFHVVGSMISIKIFGSSGDNSRNDDDLSILENLPEL